MKHSAAVSTAATSDDAGQSGVIPGFHAVVPAGGAGVRLWPLSRRDHPKFLLDLTGSGRTMLQATWDRLAPVASGITVVTGAAHATSVAAQLPDLRAVDLLTEPSGRDSMAAIGLAAAVLRKRHGDVVIGSFAADHVIAQPSAFEAAVRQAVEVARTGQVVTIGLTPTMPATGFGYIEVGGTLDVPAAPQARRARSFTEKPSADRAVEYLKSGRYLWNAGMFVVSADTLMAHLQREVPALAEGLERIADAWDTPEGPEVVAEVWPGLTAIAIDHAIAEPVAARGGVAVIPADLGWDDLGDWDALAGLVGESLGQDETPVLYAPDSDRHPRLTTVVESPGSFVVPASGRAVVLIGVPDVVVVDTPDALLVAAPDSADALKAVVGELPSHLR